MRALGLCVVVLTVASLTAAVEPARACSCIPPDPWSYLEKADGAFVGRLVSRREADQGRAVLVFRVERAVKGKIGDTVEVVTANNAACGLEASVGRRIGLFLAREGDGWFGHLCWQVEPEDLLAAAALPAPNGTGPVALIVGGSFGPAQRLALDAKGRTLAYGVGGGTVEAFSVCPGGRRVAEVVGSTGRYVVTIRDLPSLRFVRRQSGLNAVYAEEIACTSESGEQLAVFFSTPGARGQLTRVTRRSRTTIWRGDAFYASFWKHLVYVQTLPHRFVGRTTLVAVDVRTGGTKKLGTVYDHGAYQLVPNSAGTRLAGDAFEEGCRAAPCWWLVRVDLEQRPISARAIPHPTQQYCGGSSHWLRDGRIAYVCDERIVVYDAALRLSGRVSNWSAVSTAVVGSKIVGVTDLGELLRVELPSGRIDIVRRLPGVPYVLASVNG